MKNVSLKVAALAFATAFAGSAHAADADVKYEDDLRGGVKVGMLTCDIDGGLGYVIGSAKEINCTFKSTRGRVEHYTGNIKKLGVDIGVTKRGTLIWAVFAPVAGYHSGALSGLYLGATAEATVVAGLGANVLVGGTGGSIALQMVSVTGQLGLNVAAGGAALTLNPVVR
ncbi:DUF992 domain-containing protein [Kaistia algarum]|uniref:DUF992 domain-containing protein n=1 Tax=Kaistia algarum TaxID=2083279 RepID=UPI000CE82012|nr:DUF992 domain-containing protein [Kaistia algarum]MCX5515688.1 DUF992 domain-containing protein [Kaistia algarum]PPE80930.1 DUF992 domain-containing protein [Kaistia algarum]